MSSPTNDNNSPAEPITIRENIDSLSASLSDQIEMLAGELRTRWKSGQRVGVEQLGTAYEQVAKNEEQLLDLVYHEVLIREEFGEKPKLEDFTARFPQHVDRLERLFAVHGAIEDDGWDDQLDSAFADDAATVMRDEFDRNDAPSSTEIGDNNDQRRVQWPRKSRDSRPVEPPPGYDLLEEIGRGGMAVVYRAKQQILNRIVALKMLLAGGVASKEVLARVQQEARAVAQLQHPGIVQIHEVGEHRGLPYLSLEYVAGGTLHEWLNGRPLPPLEAARVIEQLARTTQYAHERGVVHRDLKPANVLLTERPPSLQSSATIPIGESHNDSGSNPTPSFFIQTKISDFGLARVLGSSSDLTATGQVIGTPSYMAPEQAAGACDDVSPAQDIYSLGAIFYELLIGRPPFRGASLFDTLEQVRTTEAVPPRQLQPRVPRDLETICLKCLEKSPERRYATAAALADDLRRVQEGDTISARPAGSLERTWKLIRRYPAIASLASLAILLTIIGAVGILREAHRANLSELAALHDKQRAEQLNIMANRERDDARKQRLLADEERHKAEQQAQIAREERLNAEKQKSLAEESQKKAEQQRQTAEAERARAIQAQTQAEASFDRTMKTIKSLADLGTSLRLQPGQQNTSKRLLDETLRLYDELSKEQGEHPALRRQRLLAMINAGQIRSSLRENEQAEKLFKQAADLVESEIQASPSDAEMHYRASSLYWNLAILYKDTDRLKESLESWRRYAIAIDAVLEKHPGHPDHLSGKANALTNECVILIGLGRSQDAIARFEEGISILRGVLSKLPDHLYALSELAIALHDYSSLLRRLGRTEPADVTFREAFELRKSLYQKFPKDIGQRTFLARLYSTQGELDRQAKKYDASIQQHGFAVLLTQSLVDEYPDIYEYQRIVIGAMTDQVVVCLQANKPDIGKPLWEKLSNRLLIAFQKFPTDRYIVDKVADWQYQWADLLWESGQMSQASPVAKSGLQAAVRLLSLSPSLSPNSEALLSNNAAWKLTVVADSSLRDFKKAEKLARRAVELVPENSFYLHTLGTVLYYAGDFEGARDQLLKAIQLEQDAAKRGSLDHLTQALKALPKDVKAARSELDASLGLQQKSPHRMSLFYSMLAMTFWRLDEIETARNTLKLVVDPENDFAKSVAESKRLIAEARSLVTPE